MKFVEIMVVFLVISLIVKSWTPIIIGVCIVLIYILLYALYTIIRMKEEDKQKEKKIETEQKRKETEQKRKIEVEKQLSSDLENISFFSFEIIYKLINEYPYGKKMCKYVREYKETCARNTFKKEWRDHQLIDVLNLKNYYKEQGYKDYNKRYNEEIRDYYEDYYGNNKKRNQSPEEFLNVIERYDIAIEKTTNVNIDKIIELGRKVNEIDEDDEVYKLVKNVSNELDNEQLIIEKLLPLFKEFYKDKFGIKNDDNPLLVVTIMGMLDKVKPKELFDEKGKELLSITEVKISDLTKLDEIMTKWVEDIIDEISVISIDKFILYRIFCIIYKSNLEIFFEALFKVKEYENYYYKLSRNSELSKVKDKYLKGNLENEKFEEKRRNIHNLNKVYTGTDFELYLKRIFEDLGYSVEHIGKTGDQGADLIVEKYGKKYVIQAKYYNSKLNNTPIQEVTAALKYYKANQGIVVTNNYFTKSAKLLAKANNIILIDGDRLEKLKSFTYNGSKSGDYLQYFCDTSIDEKETYNDEENEDICNDKYAEKYNNEDDVNNNYIEENNNQKELFCINCGEKITNREQEENDGFCDYCVMKDIEKSN